MVVDIILCLILLASIVLGCKIGFAKTFASFGSWFVAFLVAAFFTSRLKEFLMEHTGIYNFFYGKILATISTGTGDTAAVGSVPRLFENQIHAAKDTILMATASSIAELAMTIVSFVLIVIVVKLLAWLFGRSFSKKYNDGVIGFADGILGFVFGLLRGIILIYLIMAFVVPFVTGLNPSFAVWFNNASENSYLLPYAYDYNLLLILLRDFFL